MITIQELLYNRGLSRSDKVKLVRHKDRRRNLYALYKTDREAFLDYQSTQAKDVFKDVEYVVSFVGEERSRARFIGVFKVLGYSSKIIPNNNYVYEMEEIEGFSDLKERVIVIWKNSISWHQWIKNEMEVIEISPGFHFKHFSDYSEVILSFSELKEMYEMDYTEWRMMLTAIKAIYLISDKATGKLYVGSAYGEEGLWGRWRSYAITNGHGWNKSLFELINSDSSYAIRNFQFSILMQLPRSVSIEEAIRLENLFKGKLGTNACSLNNN